VIARAGGATAGSNGKAGAKPAPNRWVKVHEVKTKSKTFCATVYMPATDEFLLWGLPHDKSDVETFSLKTGKWRNAKPCEGLPEFPKRGWGDSVSIHGQGLPTRVRLLAKDGVERPTRAPTFHQITYDTKRERVLFFVGGKTFSYDPKTRKWKDLKPKKSPTACGSLVWASLCYDPVNDEAVLFGGGMALNLWGGAYTWLYDCEGNTWKPLEQPRAEQPPLRCCVQTAFDAKNKAVVLFGGDAQSKILADTWVYDAQTRKWTERKPELSPPPVPTCGLTYVASRGLVLLCAGMDNTWTYDVAANKWTRLQGSLGLSKKDKASRSTGFISCAYSGKGDVAVLVGGGARERHNIRRTWLYRLDPATATHREQKGVKPGTCRYRLGEWPRLEKAPPPDRKANLAKLKGLPSNTMVQARPPATVSAKTWSTAAMDTHRGVVIYTGGGHSGYSGNDWAHYSVADNRWSMSWAPKVAPYLWACSVGPWGWSYGAQPWSTHTRHSYKYDPRSRTCIYIGRYHRGLGGQEMWLSEKPEDVFRYSEQKHGPWQWVYDPVKKRMFPPHFGSPWRRGNKLRGMIGTPHGLYAAMSKGLFLGTIKDGKCTWKLVNKTVPSAPGDYEVHPLAYDSKRDRLLLLYGKGLVYHPHQRGAQVTVFAYPIKSGKWQKLETTGYAELSRDAMYVEKHDTLLLLGKQKWLALDCATNKWRVVDCAMPEKGYGWDSAAVYDPVHDVAVALLPARFSAPMRVFLFRYDPKTAKYRDVKPSGEKAKGSAKTGETKRVTK
jgi:hypothetical protein